MLRKLHIILLVCSLTAWSVTSPVYAGGRQSYTLKESGSKFIFQNLSSRNFSDSTVKKLTDTVAGAATRFSLAAALPTSWPIATSLQGFVYHHPIYNTLSAQAP